jgi:hypothetical protein
MAAANTEPGPVLPELRWALLVIGALVFLVGIPLILFASRTDDYFAWTIHPSLTAAYLGGVYWAACAGVVAAARRQLWADARSIIPAAFTFTTLTTIATFIHLDKFHTGSPRAWLWIAVYVLTPPALVILWFRQQRVAGPDPPRLKPYAPWVSAVMLVQGAVALGVGGALYIAPGDTSDIWPWTLTPLTARAVGAGLLGLAFASAWALRERDWERIGGPSISFLVFGVLELFALARFHNTVTWDDWQTWALVALLASFLVLGVESIRARQPARAPARAVAPQ